MPQSSHDTKDRVSKESPISLLQVEIIEREGNWDGIDGIKNINDLINHVIGDVVNYPKILIQPQSEVCIVLSSDREVQNLNLTFCGKNSPTNVLSFPSSNKRTVELKKSMGDIVLAKETIEREATEMNISFSDHLSHLIIHGLLHLMGYNHETETEAENMEGLEIAILSRLGISDPYKKIS